MNDSDSVNLIIEISVVIPQIFRLIEITISKTKFINEKILRHCRDALIFCNNKQNITEKSSELPATGCFWIVPNFCGR